MSPKVMHIFCRGFLIILQLCRKIYLLWKSPYKKGKNFSVFYNDFLFGSAGRLNCYNFSQNCFSGEHSRRMGRGSVEYKEFAEVCQEPVSAV